MQTTSTRKCVSPLGGGHWVCNDTPEGSRTISTLAWVIIGVTAWLVVASLVGVLIGRVIRVRDHQVPADAPVTTQPIRIPTQGAQPEPRSSPQARS